MMSAPLLKTLFWLPRVLGLILAGFLALFALDVFGEGYATREAIVALFMHLIPTFLVLAALAIAWRWEWFGALLCFGLAVLYVVMSWGRMPLSAFVVIAGPLVVMAVLFWVGWIKREEIRAAM